jgi:hypothetical protein
VTQRIGERGAAAAVDDVEGARESRRASDPTGGGLLPGERVILGAVVRKGMRILDLVVAPNVTVSALSTKALSHRGGTYTGVAEADGLLDVCRSTFPHLAFEPGDGTDLSSFDSGRFDAVVFARNGIGALEPDDQRVACEQEIHRVLRTGGVAVLSVQNPQAVLQRPAGWRGASPSAKATASWTAAKGSVRRVPGAWRDGRLRAPHLYFSPDGSKEHSRYFARPNAFIAEVEALGFRQLGPIVSAEHPRPFQRFVSPWYYMAIRKI